MKKLMFGLVAAAACSAMAEITSANIVGYNNYDLRAGFAMTGPDFLNVGTKAIDLTSISVGGEAYEAGACDCVYVNILNDDGSAAGCYAWLDLEGDFEPGWYDNDNDFAPISAGDVTIDPGDGLWVQGDDGFALVYSGEVLQKTAVNVPLRAGFKAAANPFPTTIDLTSISVGGEASEAGACDCVYVNILNDDGSAAGCYAWLDLEGDFEPGWYDNDNDFAPIAEGDVPLAAGQGLWVQGDDGFDLQFPALSL